MIVVLWGWRLERKKAGVRIVGTLRFEEPDSRRRICCEGVHLARRPARTQPAAPPIKLVKDVTGGTADNDDIDF